MFKILVGVGGAVLRKQTNELLVIKERIRNIEFWKVCSISIEISSWNLFDFSYPEVSWMEIQWYLFRECFRFDWTFRKHRYDDTKNFEK